ncbi:DUF4376 domain-containing protein [Thalassobius vesicularis]|uniref:DUF4376 domain-containing protein n=1 Tax=Thalassobius vesicularis TaxID=1294297 RepID=A0A4S3MDL3_9RHOB|nr:DUF4376 domain-containing protein [Thalassobius vesicularis]THD76923.1 DUF4376 domain-containing protein [Thalassobius vesicularis]
MSNIDFSTLISAQDKLTIARSEMLDSLAQIRWMHETAGITLADGHSLASTRDSQAQIASAAAGVRAGLIDAALPWKTPQGWTELTPEALLEADTVLRRHVQACFVAERAVAGQIAASDDPGALDLQAAFLAQIG